MSCKSLDQALRAFCIACAAGTTSALAVDPSLPSDALRMATSYPIAMVEIPVEAAQTSSVVGALYEPMGEGPFPAVVLLSGCAGVNIDLRIFSGVNESYMPKGIATLVVDSFTPRGLAEVCSDTDLLMSSIAFRVQDVNAAVAWLAARPEIDSKRIYLQGYSHGAIAAIAATDRRELQDQAPNIAGVIGFYPYCSEDTQFAVPTIILVGGQDDWTPAKLCEGIIDKTNLDLTVYPDAEHAFATPGLDLVYLGHRILYDPEAAADGQRRALEMIRGSEGEP